MTAPPTVPSIEVARLQVIKTLGDGGQGIVYQVAVPGSLEPLMAYKQYRTSTASEVDWAALEGLVGLIDTVDEETRSWLREHTAWPSAVVTVNGAPRGFLMRLAPEDCFAELRTPKATRTLLALEFLLNPPDYLARINLLVSQAERLGILRDLALALQRLHALGIVIGDLSPKNVVFAPGSVPRCFLIDCDAVSRNGVSVLRQVETADWSVPAGEDLATPSSDIYKLGLLAVRLLAGDQSRTDLAVIPPSMPDLADLTRRSVSEVPAQRPAPADWVAVLDVTIPMAATGIQVAAPPVSPGATTAPAAPGRPYTMPPPAPPIRAQTGRSGRIWALAGVAIFVVIAMCLGVSALVNRLGQNGANTSYVPPATQPDNVGPNDNPPVYPTEPPTTEPPTTEPPTTEPATTVAGLVDFGAVSDDQRAADVARLFDAYFSGINNRQMDAVLALYDPASSIGKANANGRASFIHDVSTTTDSDVRVTGLADGGVDGAVLTATLTFQSRQQPGFGPKRNPNEVCSVWTVTYSLTEPVPTQYRILRGPGQSVPC